MELSGLLSGALGLIFLGLMIGVGQLDTILMDFSTLNDSSQTLIQLGFLAAGIYFFLEV